MIVSNLSRSAWSQRQGQSSAVNRELEELNAKLKVMEKKRADDKEKSGAPGREIAGRVAVIDCREVFGAVAPSCAPSPSVSGAPLSASQRQGQSSAVNRELEELNAKLKVMEKKRAASICCG
jgi:hypothetical protein